MCVVWCGVRSCGCGEVHAGVVRWVWVWGDWCGEVGVGVGMWCGCGELSVGVMWEGVGDGFRLWSM